MTFTILKIAFELTLGICMKMFCDNGRIHYSDFVNDFLFWLPGVEAQDNNGLSRHVASLGLPEAHPAITAEPVALPLAAK